MKIYLFLLAFLLISPGCASSRITLGTAIDPAGRPLCLTDCKEIPLAIEKYMQRHDMNTEEDEMDYLFYRIRSSGDRFIRNGTEVDSTAAVEFLRWKIGWYESHHKEKVVTDEDLVYKVMKGSEKTGKPYVVILWDGSKQNLQDVMRNELNYLATYKHEKTELPNPQTL